MKEQNKIIQYLLNANNPYQIKVEDINVEMEYSDNNKTFNECMLNILKQKYKKGWHFLLDTLHYMWKEENLMAGRKSKYSSIENNSIKHRIWSVALYIRLSQEDEDNRQRKARK